MAVYVYRCIKCKHEFEVMKPMGLIDIMERCPKCSGITRRVITSVPFHCGWRLTERSEERFGPRDEYERDI